MSDDITCRIEQSGDAIIATLLGLSLAPNTSWSRSIHNNNTTFWRELNAAEAYRFLEYRELPDGISATVETCNNIDKLKTITSEVIPVIQVDRSNNLFHIQIKFQNNSNKAIISIPPSPNIDPKRGYTISERTWIAFDSDEYQLIITCLEDEGVQIVNGEATVTFRQYYSFRQVCLNNEIRIVESVHDSSILESIKSDLQTAEVIIPSNCKVQLYDYQIEGLRWLQFCYKYELGSLLADDMGLGKTIIAITLMAGTSKTGSPHLVICPTTILENWVREINRFCSELRTFVHHGPERLLTGDEFLDYDVIITSYGTARNDVGLLSNIKWNVIIIDEAQKIKNPDSDVSRSCRRIKGQCPVALTGTPFENRPLDLWSLMDFIEPGFLGTREQFTARYADPISRGQTDVIQQLEQTVSLFMLRRLKSQVKSDLPDKIEIDQPVVMTGSESNLYRKIALETKERVLKTGVSTNTLMPLRRLCCHPNIIEPNFSRDPARGCSKYRRLTELLENIIDCGEKAIIFTSFINMLDILETDLPLRFSIPVYRIDGSVKINERQPIIDRFSAITGPAVLLLNPQAAGLGLNIVAANHVIHYNREWNPAVEDQATDRAYRIGQEKEVMVHYMFYVETVDEIISDRLSKKRDMASGLVKLSEDKEADRVAVLSALELIPTHTLEDIVDEEAD